MRATEALSRDYLRKGIPSRPHVPVLHWTGYHNGSPQEYALLFNHWGKGDAVGDREPAGTMERPDVFA